MAAADLVWGVTWPGQRGHATQELVDSKLTEHYPPLGWSVKLTLGTALASSATSKYSAFSTPDRLA